MNTVYFELQLCRLTVYIITYMRIFWNYFELPKIHFSDVQD
jgi:hypothetical protein